MLTVRICSSIWIGRPWSAYPDPTEWIRIRIRYTGMGTHGACISAARDPEEPFDGRGEDPVPQLWTGEGQDPLHRPGGHHFVCGSSQGMYCLKRVSLHSSVVDPLSLNNGSGRIWILASHVCGPCGHWKKKSNRYFTIKFVKIWAFLIFLNFLQIVRIRNLIRNRQNRIISGSRRPFNNGSTGFGSRHFSA